MASRPWQEVQGDWARQIAAGLHAGGIRTLVVSPGSRSTPLLLAWLERVASEPGTHEAIPIVDERAAGFFALGHARVSGQPVALLCTSGSAGGHYLPALMEAQAAGLPIVAVTADRPASLKDAGANQTTEQQQLFGRQVSRSIDLGAPRPTPFALRALGRRVAQAIAEASSAPAGPLHLNVPFEKPLELTRAARPLPRVPEAHRLSLPQPDPGALEAASALLRGRARGALLAGPAPRSSDRIDAPLRHAARRWLEATGHALCADGASPLRALGVAAQLPDPDGVLGAVAEHGPIVDAVLQLGTAPVGAGTLRWLDALPACVAVVQVGGARPIDPAARVDAFVLGDPVTALEGLTDAWVRDAPAHREAPWWAGHARALAEVPAPSIGEPAIVRGALDGLGEGHRLVLGNSLAARLVDVFGGLALRAGLEVVTQRGLSGIDGFVAGTAGVQAASPAPTLLLLGDVAARHDLGALAILVERSRRAPTVALIIDNGGGRIFDLLPLPRSLSAQAAPSISDDAYERFWAMGEGAPRWSAVADAFGARFIDIDATPDGGPDAAAAAAAAVADALAEPSGLRLVVARVAPAGASTALAERRAALARLAPRES